MKITSLIFNTEMIKALLAGKKTVTRRPVKEWIRSNGGWELSIQDGKVVESLNGNKIISTGINLPCKKGDLIYVRETMDINKYLDMFYLADDVLVDGNIPDDWCYRDYEYIGKVPSMHMPRWASRITLEVTSVQLEKIGDLRKNQEQVKKEGFDNYPQFKFAWQNIYAECHTNDMVWVIEFDVFNHNIDVHKSLHANLA